MPNLMWRVKLVAEVQAGLTTEVAVARIERDQQANLAQFGLSLAEATLQAARGRGAGTTDRHLADWALCGLERAKWRLWHGHWPGCRRQLAARCRWTQPKHVREVAGIGRFQRHGGELLGYLERNEGARIRYAARRQCREPISTALVESMVNEIVARRKQDAADAPEQGDGAALP